MRVVGSKVSTEINTNGLSFTPTLTLTLTLNVTVNLTLTLKSFYRSKPGLVNRPTQGSLMLPER